MKKIFLYLFILYLSASLSYSQKNSSWFIHNPEYDKFIELKKAGLWKTHTSDGYPLGYIPAPFTIRNNPTPAILPGLKSGEETLPERYDLRDNAQVTGAKAQGGGATGGNCTSFTAMGALESRWLKMGLDTFDLSEQNLAACHGYEWVYGEGANQFICTAYLTRFSGPVLESQNLYDLDSFPCVELDPVALVPEARWLPGRDFQLLKKVIYYYGAVFVDVLIEPSFINDTNYTYYNDGSLPGNPHAFLVCGWDDNKVTAGGTGAWIVKNSWGTGFADSGFLYVSYADASLGQDMAHFPVRWDTDVVDSLYLHDKLGADSVLWVFGNNEAWELAKFEAPNEQLLTRVGMAAGDPNTIIDIEIYDDFTGGELSGLLASSNGEIIELPGVYTFEVPAIVNGDFYIKVKRIIEGRDNYIPIEVFDLDNEGEGFADPHIEQDVNWISMDGETWASTNPGTTHFGQHYPKGFNLTIRAFTSYDIGPKALFKTNKITSCVGSDVVFTYLENNPATTFSWDFGQDASPATASTQGPHTVTYSTEGTKTISLIVEGPNGKDTLIKHDYVYVTDAIDLILPDSEIRIIPGDSVEITAYGADDYIWIPSTILSSNTGQTVIAKPLVEDSYVITIYGTQGACNDQTAITIISSIPPENDNICNALLITPGGLVGNFTNENATIEALEPAPDPTDCYTDSTWCNNEPGPQHSVWFYFYGPESGIASIHTRGLPVWDNQIAIYHADTCINVVKDSLVGANDDVSVSEVAAVLEVAVIPGARYYLQMDGSGNFQEGKCDLYFYDSPVGLEDITGMGRDDRLVVYPNPATGIFNVRMSGVRSREIYLFVYNMNGQLVRERSFKNLSDEFFTRIDLESSPDGIYHIRLIDGDRVIHRKIIKE